MNVYTQSPEEIKNNADMWEIPDEIKEKKNLFWLGGGSSVGVVPVVGSGVGCCRAFVSFVYD